jgi:hypothetical protein
MDNEKVGRMNCFTCGNPLHPVRAEGTESGWVGQCPRCAKVDELFEELIRKQLRDAQPPRYAAMGAGGAF